MHFIKCHLVAQSLFILIMLHLSEFYTVFLHSYTLIRMILYHIYDKIHLSAKTLIRMCLVCRHPCE